MSAAGSGRDRGPTLEAEAYVERAGRPDDARSSVLLADAAHGAGRIEVAVEHANRAIERSQSGEHPEVLCEALEAPARRIIDLGSALQSAYLQALGGLLLAQSKAMPGRERDMEAALASVAVPAGSTPDTIAQVWAIRALPALLNHDLPTALALLERFADGVIGHRPAAPLHQFGLWALLRTILGVRDAEAHLAPVTRRSASRQPRRAPIRGRDRRRSPGPS